MDRRPAAMLALLAVLVAGCGRASAARQGTGAAPVAASATGGATTSSPAGSGPATPSPSLSLSPTPRRTASPASTGAAGPAHFGTLPPGAALPSGAQCATWVRARPLPENKGVNRVYNHTTGQHVSATALGTGAVARRLAGRVDGQFTGTTAEILRWAACKWGVDEDLVRAQAAIESWWRQTTKGDFNSDPAACPPGHGLGVDGQAGQCPQSYGILQNRYPYLTSAWPRAETSTAMNADLAYAIWRDCFEGDETWLNTVERGQQYRAGDSWGCVGRWFSGRWHTAASEQYVARVKGYLAQRIWTKADFQQP